MIFFLDFKILSCYNKPVNKRSKRFKGYDFDILNELIEKGYLCSGKHKSKSVTFTKEGTEDLIRKYLD